MGPRAGSDSRRCDWAESSDAMRRYHDEEWGVPSHDDRHLFEMLILEGAQAGLSWSTILNKRTNYRRAFDGFDPARIAGYDDDRLAELLSDPGIVRNRLKVRGAVTNARAFLATWTHTGRSPPTCGNGSTTPPSSTGPAPPPTCRPGPSCPTGCPRT